MEIFIIGGMEGAFRNNRQLGVQAQSLEVGKGPVGMEVEV